MDDYGRANGASMETSAAFYTKFRVTAWPEHKQIVRASVLQTHAALMLEGLQPAVQLLFLLVELWRNPRGPLHLLLYRRDSLLQCIRPGLSNVATVRKTPRGLVVLLLNLSDSRAKFGVLNASCPDLGVELISVLGEL